MSVEIWDSCYTVLVLTKPAGVFMKRSGVVRADKFENYQVAVQVAELRINEFPNAGFVLVRSDIQMRVDAEWVNIGDGKWLRRK